MSKHPKLSRRHSLGFLALLLFVSAGLLRAQTITQLAPASVANSLLYFHGSFSSTGTRAIYHFRPDGTYDLLFASSQTSVLPIEYATPGPAGTYTYSVTGPTTAELVLSETRPPEPIRLTFSSSDSARYTNGQPVTVEVRSLSSGESLVATSLRSRIGSGSVSTGGVAISGTRSRRAIIRAVGPGLARFDITNGLPDPALSVYNGAGQKLSSAESWGSSPIPQESLRRLMNLVGLYPLPNDSKDAVLFIILGPGAYTIQCSSASETGAGEVVIECYLLP